ncbi:hypothetical protein FO014_09215 [Serratia rhizosphaerae]|uniref:Uncharacterized protein n=1 Tax=Serratia rhizosphaerae TaxID=2597702 RepID=A0ABX6GLG3_9GAMM|nr:hypothetical protein FO014_09215 [Serratia rhizosphaerae]
MIRVTERGQRTCSLKYDGYGQKKTLAGPASV